MDEEGKHGYLFTVPDLQEQPLIKCLGVEAELPDVIKSDEHISEFFGLPQLSLKANDGYVSPSELIETKIITIPSLLDADNVIDGFWSLRDAKSLKTASFRSWDTFQSHDFEEPKSASIREAGPEGFDVAVSTDKSCLGIDDSGGLIVDTKTYCTWLCSLGLGRSSVLFEWVEEKQSFYPTMVQLRSPGHSAESLAALQALFLECGSINRRLRRFVDNTYLKNLSPGYIALADAVSTVLATIDKCVVTPGLNPRSILQLQSLFILPHELLICLQRLVGHALASKNDEEILTKIHGEVQLAEDKPKLLRDILINIFSKISGPWISFMEEWMGLRKGSGLPLTQLGPGNSFVRTEDKNWIDKHDNVMRERECVLAYGRIPSFLGLDKARVVFEIGRNLRILQEHDPKHALLKVGNNHSLGHPPLEYAFSWSDIQQLKMRASRYEEDILSAMRPMSPSQKPSVVDKHEEQISVCSPGFGFFGKVQDDFELQLVDSMEYMNKPLGYTELPGELEVLVSDFFNSKSGGAQDDTVDTFPLELVCVLSFNHIISVQSRLVNRACLQMFFGSRNLREHISLQRSFHLLGSGGFSSRLAQALFDPDLESTETQHGVVRVGGVMGLRLGGRDTWPPASSELRLALMGVLTDSYVSGRSLNQSNYVNDMQFLKSLPGDLSFAVRDMSEEEIKQCMNADSIEAFDFLRLSYKPPPPLEVIISPVILHKYDQLFKLLLRVIRMQYIVSSLFRDDRTLQLTSVDATTRRFRMESQHLVSTICAHFFDTGIESTWRAFERRLDHIEKRVNSSDDDTVQGQTDRVVQLRDYHEHILDHIMFVLFLRKRQQPVVKLLEEIFTLILQFAKSLREMADGVRRSEEHDIPDLYMNYVKKVRLFITACRGLSEEKDYVERKFLDMAVVDSASEGGTGWSKENPIVQLLSRLDMSNYYSRLAPITI